ncbi:SsrA-binding protein [uncultured Maribacter sp.]|uniref:SsrA-binding protein n=1 Tax=uncultured Maribacter sp. TaxID=431308 RepID=UPI00262416E5|nr:SsrA-binding protein [uncultured Maribacter sp.]
MKLVFFKFLAKMNRIILPSYSKKQLDLSKASRLQLAIIGWRYWITTRALD